MSRQSCPLCLQSWIPPGFVWTTAADIFCVEVPITAPDTVEFISTGEKEFFVPNNKAVARCIAAFDDNGTLHSKFANAAWVAKLKPQGQREDSGSKVVAYCHGVFLLSGEKSLCVLVGLSKPRGLEYWVSAALKAQADVLLADHKSKITEFEESISREKQKIEKFYSRSDEMKKLKHIPEYTLSEKATNNQRPVLTAEGLLPFLPRGVLIPRTSSGDVDRITQLAIAAVTGSNFAPSRDGTYSGMLISPASRKAQGIVSWVPHAGLPSYPEVRWAVQRRLPAALCSPRIQNLGRPKFDTGIEPVDNSVQIDGFDEALEELRLDDRDFRNRVDAVRKDIERHGFEAIAWFQPYHIWTEETWGIYFDAQKLDDLACSILDDLKSHKIHASDSLAAFLALGLTYAHEFFHAKVEAALSWQELTTLQPRHRRYNQRVYNALRETSDWLEEALANWSAWDWFGADATQRVIARMAPQVQGLERIVESSLDLAPAGYRDWRLGDQLATWRKFATQLATGTPNLTAPRIALPIEGTLITAPPYELRPTDIPLRFVGQGMIADRLQSHPATFNVPKHHELERALRHFKHTLDTSGGKGGHQKWTGPDQRAFILPTRDPVSPKVFNSFLHHVGINKATYVREVRPNL